MSSQRADLSRAWPSQLRRVAVGDDALKRRMFILDTFLAAGIISAGDAREKEES
jgi:hypothetical protein